MQWQRACCLLPALALLLSPARDFAARRGLSSRLRALRRCAAPPRIQAPQSGSKRAYFRSLFNRSWEELLEPCERQCLVVLDKPQPGQVGAVLRSCALLAGAGPEPCAGSGVQCAVVVLGGLGSARTNQEIRISQLQRRPGWGVSLVAPDLLLPEALAALKGRGFTAVDCGGELPPRLWDQPLAAPRLALIFRSAAGASPMAPHVATMALYERRRQLA
ncbi:unnamed protein product, partial [Effrenium voratum]